MNVHQEYKLFFHTDSEASLEVWHTHT